MGGERFDRPQSRPADVMLHALDVVKDHLVVQCEELQEISKKLMTARDISRQRFARGVSASPR